MPKRIRNAEAPAERRHVYLSSLCLRQIRHVQEYYLQRDGRQPTLSQVIRRLVIIGYRVWYRTKTLPEVER